MQFKNLKILIKFICIHFNRKPALQLYMKPGHKIGKPEPLFAKIEQTRLDELKKRYGGNQSENQKAANPDSNASVAEKEKAVAVQGDKVRALKAAKAEKAIIQTEVNILLALKKELASLQAQETASKTTNSKTVEDAEKAVAAQGDKVRALKAAKAEKAVVQAEVNILLALKKELADLQAQVLKNVINGK